MTVHFWHDSALRGRLDLASSDEPEQICKFPQMMIISPH